MRNRNPSPWDLWCAGMIPMRVLLDDARERVAQARDAIEIRKARKEGKA